MRSLARSAVPFCTQDFIAAKEAKKAARKAKAAAVEANKKMRAQASSAIAVSAAAAAAAAAKASGRDVKTVRSSRVQGGRLIVPLLSAFRWVRLGVDVRMMMRRLRFGSQASALRRPTHDSLALWWYC